MEREGLGRAEEEIMNGNGEWGYSALVVGEQIHLVLESRPTYRPKLRPCKNHQ